MKHDAARRQGVFDPESDEGFGELQVARERRRLGGIGVCAGLVGPEDVARIGGRRQHDNRHHRCALVAANTLQQFHSVDTGHLDIQKHIVEVLALEARHGLVGVDDMDDIERVVGL
ncbi:hypothetical protein D9M69_717440 [compost metagenome]